MILCDPVEETIVVGIFNKQRPIMKCIAPMKTMPFLLTLACLLAGPIAWAQSGIWTNVVSGNASGTWSVAANWANGVVANGTDSTADFSQVGFTTASTNTLDSARTIGNLIFGNASGGLGTNWILTGNTLTLATSSGAPAITADNGTNVISTVLAGTQGFTLAGPGAILLNAADTLSSNIVLNSGILQVGNSSALGATTPQGSATLSNAVFIASNAATLWILPGIAPNLKPVYASGAGMNGAQGAVYADLSSLTQGNTSTRLCIGLTANPSPALTMLGDTTIRVDGTNNTALASAMLIGQISTSNAITGTPANDTAFTLTKTGTGQLRVDPANGYTGGNIHVVNGSLAFGNNGDLPAYQTLTLDAGTFLYCRNITSLNSANSSLAVNGLVDLDARGNGTHGNDTTTATQTIGYLSGSGMITNGSAGNIGVNTLVIGGTNAVSTVFSGMIPLDANGSVGLRIQNTNGTLTLSGNNTYTGATAVNAGTLLVDGTHIGGGAYTVGSNATLGGSGTINASNTFTLAGGTILAGDPSIRGSTLSIGSSITAASPGAIVISNANLSVNGQIGDSGQPFGTLYMTNGAMELPLPTTGVPAVFATAVIIDGQATNVYTMTTPVLGVFPLISYTSIGGAAGFTGLTLASPPGITATLSNDVVNQQIDVVISAIPALTWTGVPNGNWDIGATANWAGGLTYTQPGGVGLYTIFNDTAPGTTTVNLTTTLNPEGVIVDNNQLGYTFTGSGNLTGAGSLLKEGTNTLIIANSGNTFTGGVNLQQGTLQIGNGGTSGDLGASGIANQATLALDRSDNFALGNTVTGEGNITQLGTGTATVPVSGNSSGAVTVSAGTLLLGPSGTSAFSSAVTGAGAFGVNGSGTLILTGGGNAYAGGTVISNGTLQLGDGSGDGAMPPAGNLSDNGTLALEVSGTLANNVSGSGGISLLTNITATLTGNNTYLGQTLVNGTAGSALNATASSYSPNSVLLLGDQALGLGIGTADFTTGNPVIGGLKVGGNLGAYSYVNLPSSSTLTINGNMSFGYVAPSASSLLDGTFFQVTGGSSVIVNTNGGIIQVGLGATGSGAYSDDVFVDFSQINNLTINLGTNANGTNSAINLGTLDGNPGPSGTEGTYPVALYLAGVSNSITAGTVTIGAGGRQNIPDTRTGSGHKYFRCEHIQCRHRRA